MAEQIITLITGLLGLIPTAIAAYFAIKNFIAVTKEKSSKEIWALIMSLADAAMKEAEQSLADGETKKQMVIDAVGVMFNQANTPVTIRLAQTCDKVVESANSIPTPPPATIQMQEPKKEAIKPNFETKMYILDKTAVAFSADGDVIT